MTLLDKKWGIFLFTIGLAFRLFFVFATTLMPVGVDATRYEMLSDQILKGDFDHDSGLYIVAPFFTFFYAALKAIFGNAFAPTILRVIQCLLSAASSWAIFQMTLDLFDRRKAALVASLVFAILPLTFWYVGSVGQESLFQSFLIVSMAFLVRFLKKQTRQCLIFSAIFFGSAFLTKSHILLWSPFIALSLWWISSSNWQKRLSYISIFATINLIMTLPFGLYNWQQNGNYVLSSLGLKAHFWFSSNEAFYQRVYLMNHNYASNLSSFGTDTALFINDMMLPSHISADSFLRLRPTFPPIKERQNMFMRAALTWKVSNPEKFWTLRLDNFLQFIRPGVNPKSSTRSYYWSMFALMLPIYTAAYWSFIKQSSKNFSLHSWAIFLFFTMLIYSTVFYSGNRFRSTTIDAVYIVYAAPVWLDWWSWITKKIRRF